MYEKCWRDNFANVFDIKNGKFSIDKNAATMNLLRQLCYLTAGKSVKSSNTFRLKAAAFEAKKKQIKTWWLLLL